MSYPIDEEQILITKLQRKVVYWNLAFIIGIIATVVMLIALIIAAVIGRGTIPFTVGAVTAYIASRIARSTAVDYRKDIDDITGANEL